MSVATVPGAQRFLDPRGVQRAIRIADFFVLLIATLVVFLGSSLLIPAQAISLVGFLALEVGLGSVLMMAWIGLYGLDMLLAPVRAIASALAVTVPLGAIVFLSTHLGLFPLEPWWVFGWAVFCLAHFTLTRTSAWLWARPKAAAGAFRRRVAIVGWGEDADTAMRLLDGTDPLRMEVVGLFDDRGTRAGSLAMADLVAAAHEGKVDLVVVAIPFTLEDRLLQTLRQLWPVPVDIRIARQASQLKFSPRAYGYLGRLPLLSVFDRPLGGRRRGKDLLERSLAALLLAILLPVIATAALALRLESRGPVLVRQTRCGFDGVPIEVYGFGCIGARLVGGVLRKLKIDGLPMLLNVLRGELSLVGPRLPPAGAQPAGLYQQVIDGYFARHHVKPGITGWAQINGVAIAEPTAKHDLEYVDRSSLLFDLYILCKAPFALLRKSPAL